jgi:hypothetical protein
VTRRPIERVRSRVNEIREVVTTAGSTIVDGKMVLALPLDPPA